MSAALVMAGSASTRATSPGASARSTASRWSNATIRKLAVTSGRETGVLRHDPAILQDPERGLEMTVVLAVEHDDLVTAGPHPRHPDNLGVRLRCGQRELPL